MSERKNRSLCESGRSMLFDANLPTEYWGEAVMTACYLQNRLPTKATQIHKTPYELWNGSKPDLSNLRVFGSEAYVHIPKEKRTKWDAHAGKGVLVGYSESSKGYKILHQATNKVTISRTVIFDERCDLIDKSELIQMKPVNTEQSFQSPYPVSNLQQSDVEYEIQN